MNNSRGSGGAKRRWPLDLDTRDPELVASFSLGLGYDEERVVNTLVRRCNMSRVDARRLVDETQLSLTEGGQQ